MLNFKETKKEGTIDTCTEKSNSNNNKLKKEGEKSLKLRKELQPKINGWQRFAITLFTIPLYCLPTLFKIYPNIF